MPFFLVNEDSTAIYTATLSDETGPIPGTDITSINVTLYDEVSDDIINARDKSTDNITVNSDGLLTWLLSAADNPILDDKFHEEKHRALFQFSWQGGARKNEHEVSIFVKNYRRISQTPFLPTNLLSLLAWYDADAITGLSDDDSVATWEDESGNGFDATQTIGSLQPTYKTSILNGKPIVRADGFDNFLEIGNKSAFENDNFTIIAAVQRLDSSSGTIASVQSQGASPTSGVFGFFLGDDTFQVHMSIGSGTDSFTTIPTFLSSEGFFIVTITKAGINAAVRKNGLQVGASSAMPALIDFATTRTKRTLLFAVNNELFTNDTSVLLNGDLAEVIFFSNNLSSNEINQVELYLSTKWAIPLA